MAETTAKRQKVELKSCKRCRGMYYYYGIGYGYCNKCAKFDNEVFTKVKDYIWSHGTATVLEVSEALDVSVAQINQYLRDSRLEIPENSKIFIRCEQCGTNIRSGRYCPDCAVKLSRNLTGSGKPELYEVGEKPKNYNGKMHFLSEEKTRKKGR